MPSAEDVLTGLPDAILHLDETGKIAGWYGAAEQLFGWAAAEALHKDVHELLKPRLAGGEPVTLQWDGDTQVPERRGDPAEAKNSSAPEQELLMKAKDGSDVWVGLAFGVVPQPGSLRKAISVALRDIRHRKSVDIAKSDVISSVAHELRSPLTSIKGFAATLVRRWDRFDDERRRQILSTIESDADRVTRLIAELLDLSRLEEGRLQLKRQPVGVAALAEKVANLLQERSAVHSIECIFPELFPSVMADPDKVEQVLTNLVENAVKYTEGGRVRIDGAVDGQAVRVAVTDQGTGIPDDQRQKIFRKFFRRTDASSAGSPVPSGSGLGLYICKGLIEAHGGRIWVEDAPGGGASFTFTLPLT